MDLLDYVLLAWLGFAALKGYRKGVFAALTSIAGYVISFLGAFYLSRPLAIFLDKQWQLSEKLSPWITRKLALPALSGQLKIEPPALDRITAVFNQQQLPEVFKKVIGEYVRDASNSMLTKGVNTLGEVIPYLVSTFLVSALSFFLLYTGLSLLCRTVLPKLFRTASPRPVAFMDKAGGAVLGILGGGLVIAALAVVLTPVASIGTLQGDHGFFTDQIRNSVIIKTFLSYLHILL